LTKLDKEIVFKFLVLHLHGDEDLM